MIQLLNFSIKKNILTYQHFKFCTLLILNSSKFIKKFKESLVILRCFNN